MGIADCLSRGDSFTSLYFSLFASCCPGDHKFRTVEGNDGNGCRSQTTNNDKLVWQFLPNLADLRPRIGVEIFFRIAERKLVASRVGYYHDWIVPKIKEMQ